MRDGAQTHTKQTLKSVSYLRVLEAAEQASGWENRTRRSHAATLAADLSNDGEGVRASCSLGARFKVECDERGSRVMARKRGRGMAGMLVRDRPHRDGRSCRRLGGDRRRRHGEGRDRRHRDRRRHSHRARADRRRRARRAPAGRDHRRQRYRALAGSRACRRDAPDLHDRQCRGARLARSFRQRLRKCWRRNGTSIPKRSRPHPAKSGPTAPIIAPRWTRPCIWRRAAAWCRSGPASFGTDTTGLHPVDGAGRPWQAYVFGCQVAEVEVDTVTGRSAGTRHLGAHDVGRAVNPRASKARSRAGSCRRSARR